MSLKEKNVVVTGGSRGCRAAIRTRTRVNQDKNGRRCFRVGRAQPD